METRTWGYLSSEALLVAYETLLTEASDEAARIMLRAITKAAARVELVGEFDEPVAPQAIFFNRIVGREASAKRVRFKVPPRGVVSAANVLTQSGSVLYGWGFHPTETFGIRGGYFDLTNPGIVLK